MIIFKVVRFKNFLSTGNAFTEIPLDKNPITLVSGSNGAGKSTMMCALCVALFGKPFRKIKKNQLTNSINKRNMVVEVEFKIGRKEYLVRRGIKPNIFEIFCNGDLVSQDSKNTDYQKMLEQQILKMNYKTFTQVVILGSAKFVPFMDLSAADRRAIIEDLLDIQVFTTMNNLMKQRYIELKDNIQTVETEIRLQQERITSQQKYLDNLQRDKNKLVEGYKKKLDQCDAKTTKLLAAVEVQTTKANSLQEPLSKQTSIVEKQQEATTLRTKIETNKKQKLNAIEFFETSADAACPTCSQSVDKNHCQHMIEKEKAAVVTFDDALTKITAKIDKYRTQLLQLSKIQQKLTVYQNAIQTHNNDIAAITSYRKTIVGDIEKLESEAGDRSIASEQKKLLKLTESFTKIRDDKDKLIEERCNYDIVGMLLKDSGIKTKIIAQFLPVMNQMINKYLNMLDFSVSFELDENFNETIKSRYRDDFSYNSFSEGEKQRIDLALLFAWRDIAKMRNSANTNLLVLDEVFDSSLDTSGTEEFMRLLKAIDSKTNTFIITHHGDVLYDKFNACIKFEKRGNFSQMIMEGVN